MRFGRETVLASVGCMLLVAMGCNGNMRESKIETKIAADSVAPAGAAHRTLSPPTPQEVQQAVTRVYGDAVQIENSSQYVVGDFNGDDSQDLAVRVRPAPGKLTEVNSEVANWILEDPSQVFVPDPTKRVQSFPPKPTRPQVHDGEELLVILHGVGPEGWHQPEARQSYLLRHAVGKSMRAKRPTDVAAEPNTPAPRLQGDVIQENGDGRSALLFWTGGHYAWYAR